MGLLKAQSPEGGDTIFRFAAFGALQSKIARLPPVSLGVIIVMPLNSAG